MTINMLLPAADGGASQKKKYVFTSGDLLSVLNTLSAELNKVRKDSLLLQGESIECGFKNSFNAAQEILQSALSESAGHAAEGLGQGVTAASSGYTAGKMGNSNVDRKVNLANIEKKDVYSNGKKPISEISGEGSKKSGSAAGFSGSVREPDKEGEDPASQMGKTEPGKLVQNRTTSNSFDCYPSQKAKDEAKDEVARDFDSTIRQLDHRGNMFMAFGKVFSAFAQMTTSSTKGSADAARAIFDAESHLRDSEARIAGDVAGTSGSTVQSLYDAAKAVYGCIRQSADFRV